MAKKIKQNNRQFHSDSKGWPFCITEDKRIGSKMPIDEAKEVAEKHAQDKGHSTDVEVSQ